MLILNILLSIFVSGKELKVAVIDGGFDAFISSKVKTCNKSEPKSFSDNPNQLYVNHGTNVAGLIQKYAGYNNNNYCLVLIVGLLNKNTLYDALVYAYDQKVDVINISGSGTGFFKKEYNIIRKLLNRGVIIFASTGNEGKDLNIKCDNYPVCDDKRIKAVGNTRDYSNKLKRAIISDRDGTQDPVFGITMGGTSQSTAIETGRFLSKQK